VEEWLKTRPECVQKLAEEFPFTAMYNVEEPHYLVGYTENDQLILSLIDPGKDYDRALEEKIYVCAEHFRENLL